MLSRFLAIFGILMALVGLMVVPGFVTRRRRIRPLALHRFDPDESDLPWDLSNWSPVGFLDSRKPAHQREWTMMPRFMRIK